MATATQEAPEGERLARIEATLEALVRETSEMKADIRDIRGTINRNLLTTLGVVITMWVTLIIAIFLKG